MDFIPNIDPVWVGMLAFPVAQSPGEVQQDGMGLPRVSLGLTGFGNVVLA